MKRWIVLIAALQLSGCLTQAGFTSDLNAYKNRPVADLVAKIGFPDGERSIMGQHLYAWSTDHEGLIPVTSTAFGQIGGASYTHTSVGVAQARGFCTIQVAVDDKDLVQHSQWSGNRLGCVMYARALRR